MDIMYDVAIERSEYIPGKKAIAKIQGFQSDEVFFEYCSLPEVRNISDGSKNGKIRQKVLYIVLQFYWYAIWES